MSVAEHTDARTGEQGPVGAQLARARIGRGLTVDDLYRRTNVRPPVISALERDDIGPSGGIVYARGHIRTLGQALGLDVTPLIAAFDASHPTSSSPVLIPDTDAAEVSLRSTGPPATGPRWPLVAAALLAVVIIVALVQLLLPDKSKSTHHAAAVIPAPVKHTTIAPKPTPPSLTFPVPAEGVTVRIILTTKPDWISIYDERQVFVVQRTVQPSMKPLDVHAAAALNVTIGDASAAQVSCNGRPLGPLGGPGQVVTLNLFRGSNQCPAGS